MDHLPPPPSLRGGNILQSRAARSQRSSFVTQVNARVVGSGIAEECTPFLHWHELWSVAPRTPTYRCVFTSHCLQLVWPSRGWMKSPRPSQLRHPNCPPSGWKRPAAKSVYVLLVRHAMSPALGGRAGNSRAYSTCTNLLRIVMLSRYATRFACFASRRLRIGAEVARLACFTLQHSRARK